MATSAQSLQPVDNVIVPHPVTLELYHKMLAGALVDHTAGESFQGAFVLVLTKSELPDANFRRVEYKGTPILLAMRDHRIHVLPETWSHLGGPLSGGEFINATVECPCHGSRSALDDGRVLDGPAVHPLACLGARARNGQIEVRKAIRSRSVSGVVSEPATGETLAPAEV